MSRIGKKPITLPKGVTIDQQGAELVVKGPKGTLGQEIPHGITAKIEGDQVTFLRADDDRRTRALHGLSRALTNNMVLGVTEGFRKQLELVGVGYKAEKRGKYVQFNLGFSHPIFFLAPPEITIDIPAPTQVVITGIDKQLVGAVAAKLRSLRPPEPYKGKGVKYAGEKIIRKAGKTAGK